MGIYFNPKHRLGDERAAHPKIGEWLHNHAVNITEAMAIVMISSILTTGQQELVMLVNMRFRDYDDACAVIHNLDEWLRIGPTREMEAEREYFIIERRKMDKADPFLTPFRNSQERGEER